MKKPKTARAYAKALFLFAKNHSLIEEIGHQFNTFIELWQTHQLMREFFVCHNVTREEKQDKLEKLFGQLLHPAFIIFLRFLIRKNHCQTIPFIYQHYQEMLDDHLNKQRVQIISPFALNDSYYQKFETMLTTLFPKDTILLSPVVDPEILGGFIINSHTFRIDCSIKHELEMIRQRLAYFSNGG